MADGSEVVLVLHLLATASMAGLIWFVQLVHYPLFSAVGQENFAAYERDHQRRTSWVVGPFMALEGVTALVITAAPGEASVLFALAGLVLLAGIHSSTVFLQVPKHAHLSDGFDDAVAQSLVRTNWIRTIGWSARTVVAGAMLLS